MKNNYTKKALFPLLLMGTKLFAQVGIGTPTPRAALDITSNNEGILIPRVDLISTTQIAPTNSATATASEMVYNTATNNDVTPGFYYLNPTATAWIRLATVADVIPAWGLSGNSGITSSNFLGTINNADFSVRTFNTERIRVTAGGNVGIGTIAPAAKLDVEGTTRISTLVGTGNRMVIANDNGILSTQAIPSGGSPDNLGNHTATTSLDLNGNSIIDANVVQAVSNLSLNPTSGNVGVGTTAPAAKLDVNGSARVSTLVGTGNRMVIANDSGILSTQAIPSGADNLGNHSATTSLDLNGNSIIDANVVQAVSNLFFKPYKRECRGRYQCTGSQA